MGKVNFAVVEKWIGDTLNEQLPDDDVVIDYVGELLQAEDVPEHQDDPFTNAGLFGSRTGHEVLRDVVGLVDECTG